MERKTVEVLWPKENEEPIKQENDKIRVAAYCRISSLSDDSSMGSLVNQMEYYSRYILKHPDYKLVGIYYDSGISGLTIDKRPGFKRLIRHCIEQRIDMVITKSISRFSRNSKDLLETVELLKEHNISVLFEKEKIDSMKTRNKFFLTALSAVYQQESVTISEHVKWGVEKRIKMGQPIFRDQYGYRATEIDGKKTFEIVDEEAEVIRQIFKLFLQGSCIRQISHALTRKGIKTPSGNEVWSSTSIRNILSKVNYVGDRFTNEYVNLLLEKKHIKNEGQENRYYIKNTHPAIIDEDTFNKVQDILENNKNQKGSSSKSYPLSKRITCAYCGWHYHHKVKRSIHRWICGLKTDYSTLCDSNFLTESTLIEMMKRALNVRYHFENPGAIKRLKGDLERVNSNDRFELHRMSHLMSLILAKEQLAVAEEVDKESLMQKIEKLEKEIISFEELATKIEEDREYRDNALLMLTRIQSLDEFLEKVDASILRAWIMELNILSKDDFEVRWLDDSHSILGDYIAFNDIKITEPSKFRKQMAGIEVLTETNIEPITYKRPDRSQVDGREEEVEIIEIHNNPTMELIQKIKKKYKDSSSNILKIEPKKDKKRTRVGVYARVSTREPDQLGSLEAQVAYYTFALLKDPNNQLVRIYVDEGVSGTNAEKRSGFQKMIRDCENGKIDRIITKSISRFARNTVDALDYVRKLKEHKVSIYFEKEEIDTANEEGEVLLTVYSALAQEESRSLGESVSWGKKALAKRGIVKHSVRTYGYNLNKDKIWYIVDEEAKVVRSIFERCITGTSANQISKDLTLEGIPTMKEKPSWNPKTVSIILNNPNYTGDLLYQKRYTKDTFTSTKQLNFGDASQVLIEDHHPAIIDRITWDKAQTALDKRRHKTNGKTPIRQHDKKEFFSKFICSECQSAYSHVFDGRRSNPKHRWRCNVALKKDPLISCDVDYIFEEDIIALFTKMLIECKHDKNFESLLKEKIELKKLTTKERKLLSSLEEEIQKRYQELYKVVEEGGKTGEDTTEIKRHTDGIMVVQDQINEIIDKEDEYSFLLKEKKWFMKELENLPEKENIPYRDDIFKLIVDTGIISPNNIITFNLIFGISREVKK